METDRHKCAMCGNEMILTGKKEVGGTSYSIFRCEKCKRQAAKAPE